MAWTTPRTWATNELVTAALLNTHLRDNLNFLYGSVTVTTTTYDADYSTTSGTFADVDATNLSMSLTTQGGVVVFIMHMAGESAGDTGLAVDISIDGTRQGNNAGLLTFDYTSMAYPQARQLVYVKTGLSAGTYTVKPMFACVFGTTASYLRGTANDGVATTLHAIELALG